jgi:hypothetical protein
VVPPPGKNSHTYLEGREIFCIFIDYEIFKPKTPLREEIKLFICGDAHEESRKWN